MDAQAWDPDGRIREAAAQEFEPLAPEVLASLPDFAELFSGPCREALQVAVAIGGLTKAELVEKVASDSQTAALLRGFVACAQVLDQCSTLIKAAHFRLTTAEARNLVNGMQQKHH